MKSVGITGGYVQGGGHSPLGALHGMGADQVLSIQAVSADGRFLTASPTENADLFWAIRGGGGSTFAVVTSMVIKAFPDVTTSVATFEWGVTENNISTDTYWSGITSYFGRFAEFTDNGLSAQFNIYPQGTLPQMALLDGKPLISVSPFFGVDKTLEELKAATQPWLDEMMALGIKVKTSWQQFPSFYPAFYSELAHTSTGVMPYNMTYGSRLLSRRALNRSQGLNATMAAFRTLVDEGHMFNGFQLSPTLEKGSPIGSDGNAVLPAWRDALSHTIIFALWPENFTAEEQMAFRHAFATGESGLRLLRDVTPESGSYMSESDRLEPNFQQAFFGSNYPRLLEIKRKYDPLDVFYAVNAVGSERWAVKSLDGLPTENGPLCRVQADSGKG
ncbi:FAD binding domain-containing protein [Niveomyces insectorum RCEF 264]|uniref:FAD binding domain-containing protein n=1 Tax=Niveomyces insectorum RCEF 264 TaxID=1081102 RepID=A0A162IDB0_9HYPO|nr:FAD binding domain-containing protein [Niveomyces insectorum RCEF 264]